MDKIANEILKRLIKSKIAKVAEIAINTAAKKAILKEVKMYQLMS